MMLKMMRNRLSAQSSKGSKERMDEPFSDEGKDQRAEDLTLLSDAFRHIYDESYVRHVWHKNRHLLNKRSTSIRLPQDSRGSLSHRENAATRELSPTLTHIGSGLVFRAWRIRTALSTSPGHPQHPMDLVLKIPHTQTHDKVNPTFRTWRSLLQRCPESLALLPPFALMDCDDIFGLIMPFADSPLSKTLPHWQPLAQRLREFEEGLAAVGLALRDPLIHQKDGARMQAGCWRGIPFIYDLSEIGLTSPDT